MTFAANRGFRRSLLTPTIAAACVCVASVGGTAHAQDITDEDLVNHIDNEMVVSDRVDAYKVRVESDSARVTLTGTVNNLLAKRRAEQIARSTVGVVSVQNDIVVKRSDRADREIKRDIQAAYQKDPAADTYEIAIDVRNGTVTVSGTVDSRAEKQLAGEVAAGVRGVTEVVNDVDVDYATDRADAEIRSDIRRRLETNVMVDDGLLNVMVADGDARLTGTVGSAAEKWKAYDLAWVAGVRTVDASDVEIEWWARDDMQRTDVFDAMTDPEIRRAVEQAFVYDARIQAYNPAVRVNDGRVTLMGTVDNLRAKRAAEQLASETIGVWDVDNYLRVDPETDPSDGDLEADIAAALRRDSYVDRFDVTVEVVNGHAHLYGEVDTEYERQRAESQAAAMTGVVDVSNYIDVEDQWDAKDDWEITEDIESELFWSPFVDSDEVTVMVDDGVATLTGTVDTLDERAAASENAYEGGARLVDNDLLVDYGPDELSP